MNAELAERGFRVARDADAHFLPFPYPYRWPLGRAEGASEGALALVRHALDDPASGIGPVAAIVVEPVQGNGGVVIPPDGFLHGLRDVCDRHGVVLVFDEIQAGFGRTGRLWAAEHWGVVPDLITMAKGLTSAYVQLGALGMRRKYAEHFENNVFYGGLTYNSHPLACATALATIQVYEDEALLERATRMGERMKVYHEQLAARHPSVGAVRNIGLFGIVELVRNRETMEPMAPFNGTSDEMAALGKFFRQEGLYTFVRWNYFFTNPPLVISEEEMAEGFEIIDRALEITDAAIA
mgnify:CR=1 FL=1